MAERICDVDGCGKRHFGHGLCSAHYYLWRKHGDPLIKMGTGSIPQPLEPRFWAKVDKDGPNGCWVWTAHLSGGYDRFHVAPGRAEALAHRFAWQLIRGVIPDGLELDHLCRNRACCNPDHLEPVTHRKNMVRSPIAVPGIHAAKTHCIHGHPFDAENTTVIRWADGTFRQRRCRTCRHGQELRRRKVVQ